MVFMLFRMVVRFKLLFLIFLVVGWVMSGMLFRMFEVGGGIRLVGRFLFFSIF